MRLQSQKKRRKISHPFFETGGRTGTITSPLIDTRKNANDFIFIRLCTYGRWNLLFTQHSEDIAECRSLDTHTHTQNYNLNWMCFQFCQSQRIVLLLLDSMACPHSRKRLLNNLGQDWFSIIWQPSFQPDWKNVMLKSFTQVSPLD